MPAEITSIGEYTTLTAVALGYFNTEQVTDVYSSVLVESRNFMSPAVMVMEDE